MELQQTPSSFKLRNETSSGRDNRNSFGLASDDDMEERASSGGESDSPLLRDDDADADSQAARGPAKLSRRQLFALLLLGLTVTGQMADQNLLAPNLTAIGHEFGFDDTQRDQKLGGDIALAFFVLGAPVALLCGWLGDQYNRKKLFVIVTLLGEVPCLCTFWARTYRQLFVLRALTGVSVGGTPPLLYSLMGDLVPTSRRNIVSALLSISLGLGVAIGQIIAGFFGASHGWRAPFLVVGAPTSALAVAVWFVVDEPKRGCQEEAFLQRGLASDTSIASGLAQSDGASPPGLHGFAPRSAGGDGGGDGGLMGLRSGSGGALSPHGVPVRSSSFSDRDHCEASPSLGGGRAWASDSPRVGLATPGGATLRGGAGGQPPHLHHSSHPRHHRHHAQPPPVEYAEKVNWAKVKGLFLIPTNAIVFCQAIPGCVPWGVLNTYFNDFLAQDRGMGIQDATQMLVAFGAGTAVGTAGGGFIAQWLYNRHRWHMPVLMGVTTISGIFPILYLVNGRVTGDAYGTAVCAAFVGGVLSCVTAGNIRAVLLNVNAPETRGSAFAIYALMDDLGKGLGPAAVASLIADMGRAKAFNAAISFWAICGVFLLCIACTLIRDENRLQNALKGIAGKQGGGGSAGSLRSLAGSGTGGIGNDPLLLPPALPSLFASTTRRSGSQ